MPGMNSGVNISDLTVVAAFKTALLHQGLIALLTFAVLGLAWLDLPGMAARGRRGGDSGRARRCPARALPGVSCCGSASAA
jgi:hypothetical protein